MGYAYEDEEENIIEETEEVEEEIEKPKKKSVTNKNTDNKVTIESLMADPSEVEKVKSSDYGVDNLLDDEPDVKLEDLLTKKDMKLFDAYLGKNAKRITDKNFNFAAFFFGGPYLIYRKVYGIGFFVMVLCITVQILFPLADIKWYITGVFELLVYLACGLFANQLILNKAAANILNLKTNKTKDIASKLKVVGGTNVVLLIIALIINYSVMSMYSYFATIKVLNDYFKQERVQEYYHYDGQIKADESVNIRMLLDVAPPENYKTSHANAYQYSFTYVGDANIALDLVSVSKYESSTSLINEVALFEGQSVDDISHFYIDGTDWSCVYGNKSFYAVGVINNRVYFIRHMHRGNGDAAIDYSNFLASIQPNNT